MLVLSIALVGCNWIGGGEKGSGTAKTEVREVGAFTKVGLEGALRAEIIVGSAQHVELSGDDNIVPLMTTEVSDQRLRISPKKRVQPKLELVAKIAAPALTAVSSSGSGTVNVTGVAGDAFDISTSGSAKMTARGKTQKLAIRVSGSAKVDTKDLDAQDVSIDVTGSAEVDVRVSGHLVVNISGSATVRYTGNPTDVKKSISGSGTVEPR